VRSRAAALLLILILAAACNRPAPSPARAVQKPAPQAAAPAANGGEPDIDLDADNLLNLAYGASVVSRTAESNLEVSAMQAIDGLASTFWSSPPGDPRQTLVFALSTRARIEQLGISSFQENFPRKVRFDASLDGSKWREVATRTLAATLAPQIGSVEPFEARYLRVEVLEPASGYAYIRSVHAIGRAVAPPAQRNFGGCWTINSFPARFEQQGARITGVIAADPPLVLDGGTDGRVAILTWTQGPNRGYAAVSMDPETQTISGLTLYDDIAVNYAAGAWLGTRCADSSAPAAIPPRDHGARWPMYGLAFDPQDQIMEVASQSTLDEAAKSIRDAPSARFRITAHELRFPDPDRRTAARIASLRAAFERRGVDLHRLEFVSAGSRWTDPPIATALQRLMASRVDLEKQP
jgi:F5/8 type C domain-containing protein